jgi:DNA-binding SARP family transcriptional activator
MQPIPHTDPTVTPTLLRIYALGRFTIECWDPHTSTFIPLSQEKLQAKGATQALTLLQLLLSQSGRCAHRDWILERFWPYTAKSKGDKNLDNISSYLRDLLSGLGIDGDELFCYVRKIKSSGGVYRLAPYPLIWFDTDAFLWHMDHAILHKRMGGDPLPFLEAAYSLGARGTYLSEELYSPWAEEQREKIAGTFRLCVHQLGRLSLERGHTMQAELYVRSYWATHMSDEDALRLLMDILGEQERYQDAHECYRLTCQVREQEREPIDPRTHDLAEYWRTKPMSRSPQPSPVSPLSPSLQAYENVMPFLQVIQALLPKAGIHGGIPSGLSERDGPLAPTFAIRYNASSQSSSLPILEMLDMLMVPRRQFMFNLLNTAGSSLIVSPYALLSEESREHLQLMTTHTSYLDEQAIDHLAAITQNYWDLREKSAAIDLLDGIAGHLTTVTKALKETRPTHLYKKLGALASDTAQLLGRTFHEMREDTLAWNAYAFALRMAQEINHTDLWAAGAVRLAELLMVWGEPREALPFLEEAQRKGIHDPRLRVWLSATETKIYATTGNMDAYLRTLESSKKITLPTSLAHDPYRTDINPLMLAWYEGACLMSLHQPESALPLINMFATSDPTPTLQRSLHLASMGRVHGQLGDVRKACELLLESLCITSQTKSINALKGIYQGRSELDPWKESGDVKELDARVVEVYRSLANMRERGE